MSAGESTGGREIISSRVIAAPREIVWQAFANPKHLARWWGPDGFSNTFAEFDLRPEGEWRFVMHGPDGVDYHNHSVFQEVRAPELISFEHLDPVHAFHMTMRLEEESPVATRVTWHMLFADGDHCAEVRPFVTTANEQNLARLAEEVAEMQKTTPAL